MTEDAIASEATLPPFSRHFTQPCARCGKPVALEWCEGLLPGEYVLVADQVFHPRCWEELVEEYPPGEAAPDEEASCHPDQGEGGPTK